MLLLSVLFYSCFLVAPAIANVEKTIFSAPDSVAFGNARPSLVDLNLITLSPKKLAVRTSLPVIFPSQEYPHGLQSWYLIHGLRAGQRYEVRICWAATQPTNFLLETHKIASVLDSPPLIQELASYAEERQSLLIEEDLDGNLNDPVAQSALFLRISSAADFYTTNKELMQHPPAVDVDIILDPYLLNIFPQSLVPTALYLIVLAVGSWFLSGFVWNKLQIFLARDKQHAD